MPPEECILFEHFVKLLDSISQVRPRRADSSNANATPRCLELVDRWLTHARQYYPSLPAHTCKLFFRLLFPEEDVRRRYNLKETTLARSLAIDIFGLSTSTHGAGRVLTQWSEYPETYEKAKLGCLGAEIEKVLSDRHSPRQGQSPSLQMIDDLLDELASLSGYSDLSTIAPRQKRARVAILRDLFLDLNPTEAKFLTQIILKDLRPVLYPLSETHTTKALLHYKSNAVHILTKWEVMRIWNPCMPRVYRSRSTLDEAASVMETLPSTSCIPRDHEVFSPLLGVPIEIPKSQKGLKLSHALNYFRNQADDVWAETKYDGERMQIHIDTSRPASHQIIIFSKSKRNSTLDRMGTHPIIRAALKLPPLPKDYLQYPVLREYVTKVPPFPTPSSVILDAEMVCYSDRKGDIDEFWRLRSLIESTAYGVRGSRRFQGMNRMSDSQQSQESSLEESPETVVESLQSNGSDNGDRHLKLVFFDVLFLNGLSLLDQDYNARRGQLEGLINLIPGYVSLSFRQPISMSGGLPAAVKVLAKVFSDHIANHQEGLVLKASKSCYHDHRLPWVKLKRDYIPGYGDTVDLVILGAGWNKDRARELRVAPGTFTTFFVAGLENPKPLTDMTNCTPRFQVLFTVEYGMDREQLETLNMYVKTSETHPFCDHIPALPYTFKLPQLSVKPTLMFSRPLLAELFGAGFTKDVGSKYYSLRFPRITKVWLNNERLWLEGTHLEEFLRIGRLSIGRESSEEWANRSVEVMWGCDVDPDPRDPGKVAETSFEWHRKLLKSEMIELSSASTTPSENTSSSRSRKAPLTSAPEPPAKRQKLQPSRTPKRQLRALGSMTNVFHVSASVRGQRRPDTMLQSPPVAPVAPANRPHAQQTGEKDEVIPGVATTDDPISSRISKLANESQRTSLPKPSSLSFTWLARSSTEPSCILKSMGMKDEIEVPSMKQRVSSDYPTIPMTSQNVPSPSQRVLSIEEHHRTKFHEFCWPQQFIHTPIVQFLQDSYVWIPRESENRRPMNRPPARELVPQNRRIGVIYYLLIICGCRVSGIQKTARQFTHVDKCIIFVKTERDPEIQESLSWLFETLESWRVDLSKPGNKELFVFDSNMISYDSLATFHGDVEAHALWRSSRNFTNHDNRRRPL